MFLKKALGTSAIFISAILFNVGSPAAQQMITVKGSKPTTLDSVGIYSTDTCYSGPYARITRVRAKHGTVKAVRHKGKLQSGHCKGSRINSLAFIYTANKGYRGRDAVTVYISYPAAEEVQFDTADSRTYYIEVK